MNPASGALLTDLYQLTMLQGYHDAGMGDTAVFEFFVRRLRPGRGFLLTAGLEQSLDYLEQLRFAADELEWLASTRRFSPDFLASLESLRFTGYVHAMPEGTVCFPSEPILRVTAPIAEAQLVETRLINLLHFQTLIASKAARAVLMAPDTLLVDFGLRRAHGAEAMQRLLAEAAETLRLRWSFHVARGRVSAEVNSLAHAFDLIVLGRRSGIRVMAVSRATARLQVSRAKAGPVLVLFDEGSISGLDLGVMLARRNGTELLLLIDAGNEETYRAACAAAQSALKARKTRGRCVWLTGINGPNLIQAAHREEAGCLVLPDKDRFLKQEGLDRVLDEIECPIVLTG